MKKKEIISISCQGHGWNWQAVLITKGESLFFLEKALSLFFDYKKGALEWFWQKNIRPQKNLNNDSELHTALTTCQDERCHVAFTAIKMRTHLHQAVEFLATYRGHVMLMKVSLPIWKRRGEKNKTKRLLYNQWQSVIWALPCQRSSESPFTSQLLRGSTRLVHFMKVLLPSAYDLVDCLQICDTQEVFFSIFIREHQRFWTVKYQIKTIKCYRLLIWV